MFFNTLRRTMLRPTVNRKSHFQTGSFATEYFLKSTTDTVYVSSDMDPEVDYSEWLPKSNSIFKLPARYVPPSEFKFELPKTGVPEFAFVGRSNVGKSSLIAALLDEDKLVYVSKTPGCTRSVNYYTFVNKSAPQHHCAYIVDVPGYGYAKVSKSEQKKWHETVDGFLQSRDFTVLRRVFVLIDSRHGIRQSDISMLKMLTARRLTHQVILTKSDLSSDAEAKKTLASVFKVIMSSREFQLCLPIVHLVNTTSADTTAVKASVAAMDSNASAPTSISRKRALDNGLTALKCSMAEVIDQPWNLDKNRAHVGFQAPLPPEPEAKMQPQATQTQAQTQSRTQKRTSR